MSVPAPVPQSDVAPAGPITRETVYALEGELFKLDQKLDLPVKHHFAHKVYARELFIPKGVMITGALHKFPQVNILSKGDVSVLIDGAMVRVQAPFSVVSPPGTKRIIYAHDDAIWTTILGTEMTDPDEIEEQYTAKSEAEYHAFLAQAHVKEIE